MSFYEKYEILAELRNDGVKSFIARTKQGGQAVEAHLFLTGRTAENQAMLDKLGRLTGDAKMFLLDMGDHEGTPFAVTHILPDQRGLRQWLSNIPDAPPPSIGAFEKGATLPSFQAYDPSKGETLPPFQAPALDKGATLPPFQAPSLEKGATLPPFRAYQAPAIEKGATLPPFRAYTPANPGEATDLPKRSADDDFLKLFQVPERGKGGLSVSSAPAAPTSEKKPPGEFTRLFQTPAAPPEPPPSELPTEELPKADAEFGKLFGTLPPAPAEPPPALPTDSEFDRMFGSAPEVTKAPEPPNQEAAGEFTRMFSAPQVAPEVTKGPEPVRAPEPVKAPEPPKQEAAGEFTRRS
ncbi:MAG: hypothetical protein FJW30_27085, partial [Acidobacteria bacterium]|nr:hypothetical protein [Acidobacteriota bacterium]